VDEEELNYFKAKRLADANDTDFEPSSSMKTKPKYVDGKATFAFDPSKFG